MFCFCVTAIFGDGSFYCFRDTGCVVRGMGCGVRGTGGDR
jgi:hypothetical protein